MPFPPSPVYPDAIDDDYTLFLVHNTVETKICADNAAWAQEIEILPVGADDPEIWSENGFANISGELLYYDSVERNGNGKIIKLKGCARNLGGQKTKFNPKGTWIRSYVVAEHHNQMVGAILQTQNFIGYNFDPRPQTLDWRIRNLEDLEVIFDDYSCPDVNFAFTIIEESPVTGILARFLIEISPPGTINSFRLDFGDGQFTTSEYEGTHRYAVNSRVDPVLTLGNDKCQMIITPVERENPAEPPPILTPGFEIPIPECNVIPDFVFVPCDVPEPDFFVPPLVVPCVSIEGSTGFPSIITGPNINMVSNVTITGPDEPVQILHSTVTIIGDVNIPSIVYIDSQFSSIPNTITVIVDPPIPPTIVIIPPESSIVLALDANDLPRLEVDWGTPPEMEVALTFAKQVKTPQQFSVDPELVKEFGSEFADLFEVSNAVKVEYETVGIPSQIEVVTPSQFPKIGIDATGIPEKIVVDCSEVKLPTDIKIHGPDTPIPNTIRLEGDTLPESIDLVYKGGEIPVNVQAEVVLKTEQVIPERIILEVPRPIPEKILLDGHIPDRIVYDGPSSILLELPKDIGIPVIFPEKMPEVELVYRGNPIEFKITMDQIMTKTAEGGNCVMIVPCSKP